MQRKQEEHRMQAACVTWFRLQYPQYTLRLFAVPNGGRRDSFTGVQMKREGALAGVADLILLVANSEYNALCIEMKTLHGRQSPAQKLWEANITNGVGGRFDYFLCRSFEDFVNYVKNYLQKVIE